MCFRLKAYHVLIGLFYVIPQLVIGQDQKIADSLVNIYHKDRLTGTDMLELLRNLSFNELNDSELSLKYAEELIALSKLEKNNIYLYRGYLRKGKNYEKSGDLELALEAYFKSATIAVDAEYISGQGIAYMSIAAVYSVTGNSGNAESYYNKSIQILRNTNDSISLASALLNAGDNFINTSKFEDALQYFEESGRIFKNMDYEVGMAYNLGNTGMVYAEQGKDALAEANINEAITILEKLEDYYPISVYLTYMSDIYLRQNDFTTALIYANRSLELASIYDLKEQISNANLQLSKLYEQAGKPEEAFKYYRNHIRFRDSVNNIDAVQQIADLRTDFEVSQKQSEVDLLNQKRENQRIINIAASITSVLIILLAIGLYKRYIFTRKTNAIIEEEKNRAETLLLNILPEETALELKQNGKVQSKKFESVTVLFTDFKGFTKLVESVEPNRLIRSLDFYFKKFDEVTTKYGLEKIKTIGDSYMCAGGIPKVCEMHASKVVHAAREIIELVGSELKARDDLLHFEIRIGIHTGPVIAGIVGLKKWQYDIWGDTVNIASRMESKSEPGRINISETTYYEIRDEYPCEYRGEVEVKNRGALKMYFLS
jgi:adenylate cyclase